MAQARALRNRVSAPIEANMQMFRFAATVLGVVATPLCAFGAGALQVQQPWSRPAVAGTNGVGYMVLANRGRAPDILEKVETPIAARVEIHLSSMAGGVMSMKLKDKVSIPAGGQVTFGPGGYHLMFLGLTRTQKAGDQIPATLVFASGTKVAARFTVSSGAGPPRADGVRN